MQLQKFAAQTLDTAAKISIRLRNFRLVFQYPEADPYSDFWLSVSSKFCNALVVVAVIFDNNYYNF